MRKRPTKLEPQKYKKNTKSIGNRRCVTQHTCGFYIRQMIIKFNNNHADHGRYVLGVGGGDECFGSWPFGSIPVEWKIEIRQVDYLS